MLLFLVAVYFRSFHELYDDSERNVLLPYTIDVHQVTKRLLNINVYKATAPDFLPNWTLRDFATLIAEPLTAVFTHLSEKGPCLIFGSLL